MCLVMKIDCFFQFIFQIKNLKNQWICYFWLIIINHITWFSSFKFFFEYIWCTAYICKSCIHLYAFVCCVRRFSCLVGSKVKVPLLSALLLLPCWRNIRCICLLELHIRTNWESYIWISVGIYLLKVGKRNTRTICKVILLILYR